MNQIRAQYLRTLFTDTTGHYCIGRYVIIDDYGRNQQEVTILGDNLPRTENVTYRFDGCWKVDRKYGKQFIATSYIQDIGNNAREIIGYLTSLKGCGPKTAQRIYDALGDRTFDVIENDYKRLSAIKGVSSRAIQSIKESWDANRAFVEVYQTLMPYGITTDMVAKIITAYPTVVWDMIRQYPYTLTHFKGITFKMADAIAYDNDLPQCSYDRIACAAIYVLKDNESHGHLGMRPDAFYHRLEDMLNDSIYPAIDHETAMNMARQLMSEQEPIMLTNASANSPSYVYRTRTREAELAVDDTITSHIGMVKPPTNLRQMILDEFAIAGLDPDESQVRAVETVMSNRLSIINGSPGTGKTTIIRIIKAIYRRLYPASGICFLAPTGRAACRLSESVDAPASTIHSRLKMYGSDGDDADLMPQDCIREGLVIIDESSMIDIWVARRLLEGIDWMSRIVFIGDPAQLQSVGGGAFFRDMIQSDRLPVVTLNRIYRQAQGSAIIMNAQKIADGDINLYEGSDFEIHDHLEGEALYEAMKAAYLEDARRYGILQTVCLVPTRAEVDDMNKRIQAVINPPADDKPELTHAGLVFRPGDLVMELKNIDGVVNGDIGIITAVDPENMTLSVDYYSKYTVTYTRADMDRITLAYAMTVHKAQGSEYQSVITCLQDCNQHMCIRSIPYTAITRARTICRFYGSYKALQTAITIDDTSRRQTLLSQDLHSQIS